jgi:hypothetical protein
VIVDAVANGEMRTLSAGKTGHRQNPMVAIRSPERSRAAPPSGLQLALTAFLKAIHEGWCSKAD